MVGSHDRYGYAIAIPARNEEGRIAQCLQACHDSMRCWTVPGAIAVVVNNSNDATAQRAREWALMLGAPLVVEERIFATDKAHAGSARRAALDLARSLVHGNGYLLTTDADTRPAVTWVEESLTPLRQNKGALVCGTFDLDEAEYARLPPEITRRGAIEDRYRQIARELTNLLDPDLHNTWPFHGQASGASLAMSAAAYDRIGGAPIVPCAEDRALARRFFEHDLPIIYSDNARVLTSCRLDGRAAGGMAETIASRVAGRTHICDESVESAEMVWLRADLRARLRAAFRNAPLRTAILKEAGLGPPWGGDVPAFTGFGAFWAFVERTSPRLTRRRMVWEEMVEELPCLEALRDKASARSSPPPPNTRELIA